MAKTRSWLVILSQPPYDSPLSEAGIDAALACGAFGQAMTLVLEGPALALLSNQTTPAGRDRNLHKQLLSLPLYDVDTIYAVLGETSAELEAAGVIAETDIQAIRDKDGPNVFVIDGVALAEKVAAADHVLSF